jgi:choline dehydrogenase-like flavoprotein
MQKRIGLIIFLGFIYQVLWANPGTFFTITNTGPPAEANITLCLNAKGPASCQTYDVSADNLSILTRIPRHTYPYAGIKINTPFYSIANQGVGCTPLSNGFCMFSVSNTSSASIKIKAPDYIIIGTGTAGAVLAKKLSDQQGTSVIALQNGPNLDQDPLIYLSKNALITVLSGLIGPPLYVLNETIPQIFINNRILNWIYAVPLGGASSINAGAWCRGTDQVYAQWEAIAGPHWSVSNILNTYVALEKYNGQTPNPIFRGYNGPLPIRQEPNPSPVSIKFSNAIINATGVDFVLDYNDPETPIGASYQMQYTQMGKNGDIRASSSIIFLNKMVMDHHGRGVHGRLLRVLFNASANQIIWYGNKAVGVSYYQNGLLKNVYASKGVIVSAGVKSSTILMRSGIGPASLLQSLNIPVKYDNPNVGQGLADQPRVTLIYSSNPDDTPSSFMAHIAGNIIFAAAQTPSGRELIKFITSHVNLRNGLFAQIAWLPAPNGDPTVRALRFASINPIPGITLVLFDLVQPASRGTMSITSKDPLVEPLMNLGVFQNPADLNLYVSGFQNYITNINAQLKIIDPSYEMIFPDPEVLNHPEILTEFIKDQVASNMHFQSHCRMAPLNQGGVVDDTGHVYGVQNLIVADDSIVPVAMDGSPMATAYLIAANIANLLH